MPMQTMDLTIAGTDHSTLRSTLRTMSACALVALVAVTGGLVAGPATAAAATTAARIEAHLQDMHARLHVTPAQEDQWKAVAQVMRDNEAAIAPLIEQRRAQAATMTALDDLASYERISESHVQGIRSFSTAFGTLYAAMSDAQKKDADVLFRHGIPGVGRAK